MKVESNKINNFELENINEDNFLDLFESFEDISISNDIVDISPVEDSEVSLEQQVEFEDDIKFKKFLVDKVTNDITNVNFNNLDVDFIKACEFDDKLFKDNNDDLSITFHQFISENLTPKFDINVDMENLYDLNNNNQIEFLKKGSTFNVLNQNNPIIESKSIKSEITKDPNLLSSINLNADESLLLMKDNDKYSLFFSLNGEKNILKTYDKLLSKNMSIRMKEDINGVKTYVLRANTHRYMAKLDGSSFEIFYEL